MRPSAATAHPALTEAKPPIARPQQVQAAHPQSLRVGLERPLAGIPRGWLGPVREFLPRRAGFFGFAQNE